MPTQTVTAPAEPRQLLSRHPGVLSLQQLPDAVRDLALLLLLSVIALLVHGYHFAVDDASIYIPAVERVAHPGLFPYGDVFFLAHAHMSIFSTLVGGTVRWLHLPLAWAVLGFQLLGIFLLLVAGLWLARLCFASAVAQWAATVTLMLTTAVPVAGTALVVMDPYLTARSLSTPLTLLALAACLARRSVMATVLLAITALLHPLMAVYCVGLIGLLVLPAFVPRMEYGEEGAVASFGLMWRMPAGFHLGPATEPYRQTLYSRTFFFAWAWQWYEWVGVLAPLAVLFALPRVASRVLSPIAVRLCRAIVTLGVVSTLAFLVLSSSSQFDDFVRLQPMRSFQLIYAILFLLLGGLLGEFLLRRHAWRWALCFLPLVTGMYALDRASYGASEHLELPGRSSANPWVQAFRWVAQNTPQSAVFALPPRYLQLPEEDMHGFRAIAERSMLADWVKDSGVASVFPQVAPEWAREQQLTEGWDHYTPADFAALSQRSPVSWVIVERRQGEGLDCAYRNRAVAVCHVGTPTTAR